MFRVGDKVKKKTGFHFPGVVLAVFGNTEKTIVFIAVECVAPQCKGMTQIYRQEELELRA
jgi:hypothetical protein